MPKDGGKPVRRSGYTLTILRKQATGNWLVVRDANLLRSTNHDKEVPAIVGLFALTAAAL